MPSHRVRARLAASAAARNAVPGSPASRCPRARERSRVSQWWLVSVFAAAVCRSEFTDIPGRQGGWVPDSQAACRARSAVAVTACGRPLTGPLNSGRRRGGHAPAGTARSSSRSAAGTGSSR